MPLCMYVHVCVFFVFAGGQLALSLLSSLLFVKFFFLLLFSPVSLRLFRLFEAGKRELRIVDVNLPESLCRLSFPFKFGFYINHLCVYILARPMEYSNIYRVYNLQ